MCCDPPAADRLPPQVAAMLASYRALAAERPADWGGESDNYARGQPYGRWLGVRLLAAVFAMQADDWPATVRACLTDPLPAGLVVASLDDGGLRLRAGPAPYVLEGGSVEVAVLLDSHLEKSTRLEVDGTSVPVPAGGVELVTARSSSLGGVSDGPRSEDAADRCAVGARAYAPVHYAAVLEPGDRGRDRRAAVRPAGPATGARFRCRRR